MVTMDFGVRYDKGKLRLSVAVLLVRLPDIPWPDLTVEFLRISQPLCQSVGLSGSVSQPFTNPLARA